MHFMAVPMACMLWFGMLKKQRMVYCFHTHPRILKKVIQEKFSFMSFIHSMIITKSALSIKPQRMIPHTLIYQIMLTGIFLVKQKEASLIMIRWAAW